jgi:multidrug transporter EmrE-like cation transporter
MQYHEFDTGNVSYDPACRIRSAGIDRWSRLLYYVFDPFILSAYAASLGGSVAWIFVVERYDLSLAFPIYVGLTVLSVAVVGILLFGEPLSWQRALSIALILAGLVIGSRT